MEDGELERFLVGFASRPGGFVVNVEPGGVGGEVPFRGSHLVDSPGQEFLKAHTGVREYAGGGGCSRGVWGRQRSSL